MSGIEKGRPWGKETQEPADEVVRGGDAALAAASTRNPGALLAFEPDATSDVGRALGLAPFPSSRGGTEVTLDLIRLVGKEGQSVTAVNAVVIGASPRSTRWWTRSVAIRMAVDGREAFTGRATGVVLASGEYSMGDDLNPRSHPGDAKIEGHVYSVARGERSALRARLATGSHLPHPRITQRTGGAYLVESTQSLALTVDGIRLPPATRIEVAVMPGALRLLIAHP